MTEEKEWGEVPTWSEPTQKDLTEVINEVINEEKKDKLVSEMTVTELKDLLTEIADKFYRVPYIYPSMPQPI